MSEHNKSTSVRSVKSTESARLLAAAKKASLQVEAEELEKSYQLEMEGLKLKFKAKKHEVESAIKRTEAEEKVLADGDGKNPNEYISVVDAKAEEERKRKNVQDWMERNEEYDRILKEFTKEQQNKANERTTTK
jgi:hypothetical protein